MTKSIIATFVLAGMLAISPALAKSPRKPVDRPCVDSPAQFSWSDFLLGTGPAPQPNGCAPPVYSNGEFVGQDPDPNVRLQLRRDSDNEGYRLNTK